MINKAYRILVLSDLKSASKSLLNSSVEIAKIINGEIEVFHVKKPTEIVESESQLSAVRTISEQSVKTHKKLKLLTESLSQKHNIKVKYKYAFGNVKQEIKHHIKTTNPDIIVVGKRKQNLLSFVGDDITDFVLQNFNGSVLIAANENAIEYDKDLSLGIFQSIENSSNKELTESFINYSKQPIKTFKISDTSTSEISSQLLGDKKSIEYVFDSNPNAIQTISDYTSKHKINLLCLDRNNEFLKKSKYTKDLINRVNVSLLVT
ncbi:universal stress protein [Winogradskyella sp.]|uniref:universal stress protein n=1 Tax=Winogradskyella sp. TaxID=1883156 RepID=UPI003F6C873A